MLVLSVGVVFQNTNAYQNVDFCSDNFAIHMYWSCPLFCQKRTTPLCSQRSTSHSMALLLTDNVEDCTDAPKNMMIVWSFMAQRLLKTIVDWFLDCRP